MSCGIYKIENIENYKVYIGRSKNIESRWKQHLNNLQNHSHHLFKLQKDYDNAIDKSIFEFNIIEEVASIKQLKKKEQYYINFYKAYPNGYNLCSFADNPKYITEGFYEQIKLFALDIGLSERTVTKNLQILNNLDIIVSKPMPRYKDKYGNWHTDVTLFVDKLDGWEDELRWGEEFLFNNKILHHEDAQS